MAPGAAALLFGQGAQPLGQRAQFGQGLCAQPVHQLRALRLDGALADPQLIGDLLVQRARDHVVKRLVFARRQGGDSRAQVLGIGTRQALASVARERALQRVQQALALDRIFQLGAEARIEDLRQVGRGDALTGDMRPSITTTSTATARAIIKRTNGIGIAAPVQLTEGLRLGAVAIIDAGAGVLQSSYGVAWLRGR